jgi:hypothetical protein
MAIAIIANCSTATEEAVGIYVVLPARCRTPLSLDKL